jgi:hypothetical protein
MRWPCCPCVTPNPFATDRQELHKYIHSHGNGYIHPIRRIVGCGVFYMVRVISNTQYVVKPKQMISTSQNILLCVLWRTVLLLVVLCWYGLIYSLILGVYIWCQILGCCWQLVFCLSVYSVGTLIYSICDIFLGYSDICLS